MVTNLKGKKILITGGAGFLGTEVKNILRSEGCVDEDISIPLYPEFDLRRFEDCSRAVQGQEIVFHLATRLAGVAELREKPGELFYDNIVMNTQLIEAARQAGVKKLVFTSTIHSYPKSAPLPLKEQDLWIGYPETSYAVYGLTKRIVEVQLKAYEAQYGLLSAYCILPNLYGSPRTPPVSFFETMLLKFRRAKTENTPKLEFRGTGRQVREFLHVGDAARALVLAMEHETHEPLNISSGEAVSLHELAELMKEAVGFEGRVVWNGEALESDAPRYLSGGRARIALGFEPRIALREGIREIVKNF